MIRQVTLRRFKRFRDVTFDLPGHIVLAGPNNTGKTTVLQAIAAWGLTLSRWKEGRSQFRKYKGGYSRVPIARQDFYAVPLRAFDLLWNERQYRGRGENGVIEIELVGSAGWRVTMELIPDTTEQIYIRPKSDVDPAHLTATDDLRTVYIPPMSGLSPTETYYKPDFLEFLLGQARPGEIIRNLLVEAHQSETAWQALTESIRRLFGYVVHPPVTQRALILAEYSPAEGGPRFDIASAGSGFQQVLMLLSFLHTREGSVLLFDEPDAHLHMILQDAIYSELRSVALKRGSQLVVATHSEVIINAVEPRELCMLLDKPRLLDSETERANLAKILRWFSNTDILLAMECPGILYVEDHTDINILRAWAKTLDHPAYDTLTTKLFWKPKDFQPRQNEEGVAGYGSGSIKAKDHYALLRLLRENFPGLELVDGDDHPNIPNTPLVGSGLQRQRWRRYEIESYLIHPAAFLRFVEKTIGPGGLSEETCAEILAYFDKQLPGLTDDPFGEYLTLNGVKASEKILPPLLLIAGLPEFPKRNYYEIAAVMLPKEIHPEVTEKLDAIQKAFGLEATA